jgi:hypothetical protein
MDVGKRISGWVEYLNVVRETSAQIAEKRWLASYASGIGKGLNEQTKKYQESIYVGEIHQH